MQKTCLEHECFKKGTCRHKSYFGKTALCLKKEVKCRYRSPLPYGRYALEDIIWP